MGPGTMLRGLIERDELRSAILWGPPGSGKTTIASIIGDRTRAPVARLSAVSSGVADVRKVIAEARKQGRTVLFIDEIHRFNKSQQDALLNAVEDGVIVLIGATTENPFFEVNSPLISRSLLFRLEPLAEDDVRTVLHRALERELTEVRADPDALDHLAEKTGGDARVALTALEAAALASDDGHVTLDHARAALERRVVRYDKAGDRHYDVISAFIKSMRGSDPDAALFWLAEMIEGGEDPRFICRRMIILASEDIGMADPNALVIATSAAHALEHVGLPEAHFNMAQAAIYLSLAPKSNAVARAMWASMRDVRQRAYEVPLHLRDSSGGSKRVGHGKGYRYTHDDPTPQDFRPPELQDKRYWEP